MNSVVFVENTKINPVLLRCNIRVGIWSADGEWTVREKKGVGGCNLP
jgi:hypothetical protein